MPAIAEWVAPPSWTRIEFISDLHLSEHSPRTTLAWERYLGATQADGVFILGDLFEAWAGDDSRHHGFEAHCVHVLARASGARTIAFMAGNRDFLVGAEMLSACGLSRLEDPSVLSAFGNRLVLTHGDALCTADAEYMEFRQRVRDPAWQQAVLARPLEERRALARQLRVGSVERQLVRSGLSEVGIEIDVDETQALAWLERASASTMIHGHTHRPCTHRLGAGYVRHVLSDWSLDHDGGARRAEVLRLDVTGLTRHALV